MAVVQKKKNLEIKDKTIKQIQKFALDYPYIILASSKNVRSDFIHDLRSVLSKTSKILFGKKKIIIKALEKQFEKNKEINKFIQKFDNHSFLVFTNDLMTKDILQSKSIRGFLRCGDVCEDEIIIPAGNVTINGSECSSDMDFRLRNCGVPCYVKNGKVVLENEYCVCNKGELLDEKKAKILRFIGHKLAYLTINVIDQNETK